MTKCHAQYATTVSSAAAVKPIDAFRSVREPT
jgi:hypothetical protein